MTRAELQDNFLFTYAYTRAITPAQNIATKTVSDMEHSSFSEHRRRIWVQSSRIEYLKLSQRYDLPARVMTLLRKDLDYVVLQGGFEPTVEFWHFCCDKLGYSKDQAIFTSGAQPHLDLDMDQDTLGKLETIIKQSGDHWTLVP